MRITVNKLDNGYTMQKTAIVPDTRATAPLGDFVEQKTKLVFTSKELLLAYLTEQL